MRNRKYRYPAAGFTPVLELRNGAPVEFLLKTGINPAVGFAPIFTAAGSIPVPRNENGAPD